MAGQAAGRLRCAGASGGSSCGRQSSSPRHARRSAGSAQASAAVLIVGGQESMSLAPHVPMNSLGGFRMGAALAVER